VKHAAVVVGPLLCVAFLASAVSAVPARAAAKLKADGLELGLRGGWYFQLNQPVSDSVMDRGRVSPGASVGIDLEAGPTLGNHLSILIRFGYKTRIEEWESPDPDAEEPLKLVYSLVHLPSINVKFRPWYKRVSLYFTAGGGIDLVVYEPSTGVFRLPTLRLPGGGVNLGIGLDFFISSKWGLVIDLRDHLSFHGEDFMVRTDDVTGEPLYDLSFGRLHHNLSLSAGVEIHM